VGLRAGLDMRLKVKSFTCAGDLSLVVQSIETVLTELPQLFN
jgi:hypothetical protein